MGNGNQLITADKALMGGDTNGNKMDMRTPIEIALDIDENGMTTARKLYAFLELANGQFSRWVKTNITENEFAEDNGIQLQTFYQDGDEMVDSETGERFKTSKPKNPMRKLFTVV